MLGGASLGLHIQSQAVRDRKLGELIGYFIREFVECPRGDRRQRTGNLVFEHRLGTAAIGKIQGYLVWARGGARVHKCDPITIPIVPNAQWFFERGVNLVSSERAFF